MCGLVLQQNETDETLSPGIQEKPRESYIGLLCVTSVVQKCLLALSAC